MKDDLGVGILCAIRENDAFALRCLRFLVDRQDADEIVEGTSLHRNRRGLSKPHAEMLAGRELEKMPASDISRIASEYAHSQLADAVRRGELTMAEKGTLVDVSTGDEDAWDRLERVRSGSKRRREREIVQSEDEEDETDLDDPSESEVCLDEYGIHHGGAVMPSASFVSRVGRIVRELRERGEQARAFPRLVARIVNAEDGWRGTNVSARMVDAALYQVMPAIDLFVARPKTLVRIFWASEGRWATAETVRVRRGSDTTNVVELFFPDEEVDGTVTGVDTLYAYELAHS